MFITSPLLASLPHIRHGFFTRQGGVSEGIYASLNCGPGSNDNPAHIKENRAKVCAAMGMDTLNTLFQVHGGGVMTVNAPWEAAPKADAMASKTAKIALGILTADCVPILLADSRRPIVGCAHAGWKGAIAGVAEATVERMLELGAQREDIVAAIGPAIGWDSYEVGPEFKAQFMGNHAENGRFFKPSPKTGHWYFDIKSYVKERLASAGVERVETLPHDTCREETLFFSYRRTTLRGEKDYGRQVSAIGII